MTEAGHERSLPWRGHADKSKTPSRGYFLS